jgi:predicted nucleotidyltransferase
VDKARVILGEDAERGFDISCGAEIETPQGKCSFFFDDEMIERIDSKELLGIEVPVLSVEDNIVFKAIHQRGEDVGKHDIDDIRCMIANQKIDLKYLERRIRKSGSERRVKEILERLISDTK